MIYRDSLFIFEIYITVHFIFVSQMANLEQISIIE